MSTKFYFAKYSFETEQAYLGDFTDKSDQDVDQVRRNRLISYIKTNEPVYIEEDAEWRFGETRIEGDVAYGKFGKIFADTPKDYDESVGDFVTTSGSDADVSYFAIFFDINVIAYNRRLRIGPKQFQEAFMRGFRNEDSRGSQLDIRTLDYQYTLDDVFSEADRVYHLDFDLEPTNPGAEPEMEDMDERFKEANTDSFEIDMNSEDELNLGSRVVRAAKGFVENSYGDAVVDYIMNGRDEQFSTKSKSATKKTDEPEEIDDLENQLGELKDQAEGLSQQSGTDRNG